MTCKAVLLRRPGSELDHIDRLRRDADAFAVSMPNELACSTTIWLLLFGNMASPFTSSGAGGIDKPNGFFIRDLMLMTPEGAIVTRPASNTRAGEERFVAEALGELGVPVLMTVHGEGTFEGADVSWIDDDLCFLAEGSAHQPDKAPIRSNGCCGDRRCARSSGSVCPGGPCIWTGC